MQVVSLGFYDPFKHESKVAKILYMADGSYYKTHATNWSPSFLATYFDLEKIG
jgi:hypothetical protein